MLTKSNKQLSKVVANLTKENETLLIICKTNQASLENQAATTKPIDLCCGLDMTAKFAIAKQKATRMRQ